MDIIKKYKELLIIGLVIIGFAFYWYEYRPSSIKKECCEEAKRKERSIELTERFIRDSELPFIEVEPEWDYNTFYKQCLQRKGL